MKNQLKKSLSLLMAVLMMLSCWVWIAPDKAEAGAPTNYTVEISFKVSDACNGGEVRADVTHIANNGTGSSTTTSWALDKCESDEGEYSLSKDFAGWPSQIYVLVKQGGARTQNVAVTSIKINGKTVLSGTWTMKPGWWSSDDRTFKPNTCDNASADGLSGTVSGTAEGTWEWPRPALNTATATLDPTSHTLAKINSGTNSTSTISLGGFVDTYGVNWTGTLTPSFTLRADGDVTLGSNATIAGSGNSRTITIKPWFQTLYPGKQGAKLYIDWGVNNKTKSGTETITVDFPTYKATFYANGGKIGADDSEAKDTIEYEGDKMNIGSVIGKAPAYATKPGFEFKGFYSTQNADATGLTASFSGTKFKDNETTIPAASSGNGDTHWYAAWQATPITATFLTADNQLIGEVEGRYNNNLTASNMYNGDAGLNAAVKAAYTGSTVKFNSNNEPIYTDGSTTYNFAGWKIIKAYDESVVDGNEDTVLHGDVTFQAVYTKADAKTYTVSFEDGNGNVISTKSGYKYRDDVTNIPATDPTKAQDNIYRYEFAGWTKDIGKAFYTVDEYDNDENGARIAYTHKDGAEFIVKGDASYVPVFRMIPREYTVTYSYKVDGGTTETTDIGGYKWEDTPVMPEIKNNYTYGGYRYYIDGWQVGTDTTKKQLDEIKVDGNLLLTAVYGQPEAAKYTINFYDKDGKLLNADSNIYSHNDTVTAPEVENTIDTEDSLFTFVAFKDKNGNIYSTTAKADADYYAEYTRKDYADVHFYNYDGTLIYEMDGKENTLFVGDKIPAYSNIDKETNKNVLPTKAEDVVGTYNFTGWADGSGNEVRPGTDSFTGDTYLYAQYETVYKNYTVKFLNDVVDADGNNVVVSEETYHYGDPIEIPANPVKAADVEYIYDFKAWTPDVSEVCYGDATYTATYRRTPQYYKVTWFKDFSATTPIEVLSESNYKYNQKIQQAVMDTPVSYGAAPVGKTWALKHWVQCDENGNDILVDGKQVIFVRGQKMGAEALYFYPVFEAVDNVLTVTFYKEDGTTLLGEAKIPYGKALADYDDEFAKKAAKQSDADYHYIINNWVKINGGATVTTILEDVSVKATYTPEAHDKQLYEVVAEPTANVPGYGHYKCEAEECTSIDYNVVIAPVADEAAPAGQIYVGSDKWTLENYEDGIDYDDITYVGPNTQLVVNAWDTGTRSMPWNLEAKLSRGVGKIEYYISEEKLDNLTTVGDTLWTAVYDYEALRTEALNAVLEEYEITLLDYNGYIRGTAEDKMKKAEIDRKVDAMLSIYNANATGVVSNLGLVNGKTYIIYIRVSDREGNGEVNRCYFSSGTISYGTTAPVINVTGEGYGTKFCAEAEVTVTDDKDGVKAYLDGEEVTLTDGKFTCDEAGVHTVTAIDKHGNKTTKTFEIKGNHTYRNYTVGATCENAGSRYDLCVLCGAKANEAEIPALGHSFTVNYAEKAPTCVVDGYRTYICDNNCGEKLVLKPTDAADALAAAKKWVDGEDGAEGSWVSLTADDLKHLKATGTHTYAKVKDEDGNDTAEDAWVIDKVPTCTVEGSKHKDCIKCGLAEARVTEVIPVDTKDGHKFYREKVTKEPTCTEKGEKTKTCRYCGDIEVTAYIDALGHIAGEYEVTLEPTCTAKGSKVLKCGRCDVKIGEADKDGNYNTEDPVAVEIPELGHAWNPDGEIYQATETDAEAGIEAGKWYQKYVCGNDASHIRTEEVEGYKPPVYADVIFKNGDTILKTINKQVGATITANLVDVTPTKAEDATYKYTFSHWVDADGKEVKFPITVVEGGATYYAVFAEKYINYTITYYNEDGITEFKKIGYRHNGEEVTLADGPSKAGDWQYTHKFAGWKVIGSDPEVVYTDKVTINGANINLVATYSEKTNKYAVTYAYSKSNILETFEVEAGATARPCAIVPEKAYDSNYHYTFKAWNRADQLAKVESNIYTTPDFNKAEHAYETTVKSAATCTANRVDTKTCACGYSYDVEVKGTALGHIWSDPVYSEGVNTITCTREGCGLKEEDKRSFTVEFFVNADDTAALKTISYVPWGTTIDATRLPAAPTKDSTATTDYTFRGWAIKGTTAAAGIDFTKLEIKQDYKFVALFTETTREYSVIFAYEGSNVIKKVTNVKAGSDVTFDGETPVQAYDESYHYTFSNWKGYTKADGVEITVSNVQKDEYIIAEFTKTKHTYTESSLGTPTCQNGSGTRYTCTCGKYYDVASKPLDHNFVEVDRKEATETSDGYIKYVCDNEIDDKGTKCGAEKTETLKYVDNKIEIKVYVTRNGAPQLGVKVEIQSALGESESKSTGTDGSVTFTVEKDGIYTCYVGETQVALTKNGDGFVGYYNQVDDVDCSCACHRDNFWGTIFRFIHKIIKFFTGEFKCCNNPDPMYG